MGDDIFRQAERVLDEKDAQTHPAIRRWDAMVEQLRRSMPHGREGLVVLAPDPNSLGYSDPERLGRPEPPPIRAHDGRLVCLHDFWAIGVGRYSYVPETGQHVITPFPPPEVEPLSDEERQAGMLQLDLTPLPGDVGLEDFEGLEEMLDEVYTRLNYCATERPFSYHEVPRELELMKYHLLRAAELTVELEESMPQITREVLARWVVRAYDEIVRKDEGDDDD